MIKPKLGYQALIAIILGIMTGLFFGPYCHVLKPIGDIFIFGLQVLVIPYIPSLLMHGLGSLTPALAKKLFKNGWFILVLLWVFVLTVCYIVKVIIPVPLPNPSSDFSIENLTLISSKQISLAPGVSLLGIIDNSVPVITLFSILFGLAIMHLKEKEPLLGLLERINTSLEKIIKWISIVAPIGIFAHVAYVMGTINFHDLSKLQLYLSMVIGITLFLSVWVLPGLVSCCTATPFKEVLKEFRIVAFLPFATAIPTLCFPFINNSMRRLAERKNLELGAFRNTSQTILPIGFGFAQIGNFIPLLFIFFLSFFYRLPLTDLQSLALPFLITFFSIGTPQFTFVALPYLLKMLNFPKESFGLYAEISSITLNFQVLLSTVSILTFMYLVILRYYGLLEIQWRRLLSHIGSTAAILIAFLFVGKNYIHTTDNYHDLYYNLSMKEAIKSPPSVTLYRDRVPPPPTPISRTLARVLDRGVLRVGYDIRNVPFCYLNTKGEVVGYDIAYAYQLAKDLDVKLELIPFDATTLLSDIATGYYDIAMSAILMNEERILQVQFTNAYIEQNNVLLLPRSNLSLFHNYNEVSNHPDIRIGGVGGYKEIVKSHFPQNTLVPLHAFDFTQEKVDAILWSELPAYIWCLAHPDYTAISFDNTLGKKYFAYPCQMESEQFLHFLNDWLQLKQEQGFEQEQRQYWFLGKAQTPESHRWSILRNVLHWVN